MKLKIKILFGLMFFQFILFSSSANSNVMLTECNTCFSDSAYEFKARSQYESSNLTVVIINTSDMKSRKYDVIRSGSTRALDGGIVAFRESLDKQDTEALNGLMSLHQEIADKDAIDVPEIVLPNGYIVDSMWDLLGHSANQNYFEDWIVSNVGLVARFTLALNNATDTVGITNNQVTYKFLFEFADGSKVLVEVRNLIIVWLTFTDKDNNDILLSNPGHRFVGIHTDYNSWDLWTRWVMSLGFLRYYDEDLARACSLFITTCESQWQEDEVSGRSSSSTLVKKKKDVNDGGSTIRGKWVQVCTLHCSR